MDLHSKRRRCRHKTGFFFFVCFFSRLFAKLLHFYGLYNLVKSLCVLRSFWEHLGAPEIQGIHFVALLKELSKALCLFVDLIMDLSNVLILLHKLFSLRSAHSPWIWVTCYKPHGCKCTVCRPLNQFLNYLLIGGFWFDCGTLINNGCVVFMDRAFIIQFPPYLYLSNAEFSVICMSHRMWMNHNFLISLPPFPIYFDILFEDCQIYPKYSLCSSTCQVQLMLD